MTQRKSSHFSLIAKLCTPCMIFALVRSSLFLSASKRRGNLTMFIPNFLPIKKFPLLCCSALISSSLDLNFTKPNNWPDFDYLEGMNTFSTLATLSKQSQISLLKTGPLFPYLDKKSSIFSILSPNPAYNQLTTKIRSVSVGLGKTQQSTVLPTSNPA